MAPAKTSASPMGLFLLGSDELVSLAMDIDDFNLWIVLEVLAQLGDVDIHRTGIEIGRAHV